jgi:hypothetical protein
LQQKHSRISKTTILAKTPMTSSSKLPLNSALFVRWLPLLAFFAVVTQHIWFVNTQAINIPHQDDIYDFLQFVSLVENAESTGDAVKALFNQYNDHRTSASRIVVWGVYLAEGELNFHTLTVIANLALPLILFLFYLIVRKEKYCWVYLLVSALLLLNLGYSEIVLFSQAAFAYYWVCLYAFACIFTLHKVSWPKFLLAAVFCTLSSLTLASGQIVWLLGLASLLHQCLVSGRRSLVWPLMWMLVAAVMLVLWHTGFTELPHAITSEMVALKNEMSPATEGELKFGNALIDGTPVDILKRYAAFFLVILGCAPIQFSTLGAGAVGLVMAAVLLFVTLKFYKQEDIRLTLFCWFIVGFAGAVTVGRSLLVAPDYVLASRYGFLSTLLMSALVLLVQVRFALFRTPAVYLVVLLTGAYWSWADHHFDSQLQKKMQMRYLEFNKASYMVTLMPKEESNAIVNKAISAGIYTPPCRPFPGCESPSPRGE